MSLCYLGVEGMFSKKNIAKVTKHTSYDIFIFYTRIFFLRVSRIAKALHALNYPFDRKTFSPLITKRARRVRAVAYNCLAGSSSKM